MTTTAKRPTIKSLTEENARLAEQLANITGQLKERQSENDALRGSATKHAQELSDAQETVGKAMAALAPFHDKTKDWPAEEWPPLQIAVVRKITWADIKNAANAYAGLRK
jgi:predicted nuclease with TOPRIM domain